MTTEPYRLRVAADAAATPPQAVTLSDCYHHLRIDTANEEDSNLTNLIRAATRQIEQSTQLALTERNFTLVADRFPPDNSPLFLTPRPVSSVVSLQYHDPTGTQQTLDASAYLLDPAATGRRMPRVGPAPGQSWPQTQRRIDAVKLTVTAGFTTVPEDVRAAALLLIGHYFENPEATTARRLVALPIGVQALLSPYTFIAI